MTVIDRSYFFAAKQVENSTARMRELITKLEIRTGDKRENIKRLLDAIDRDVQAPCDNEYSHG